METTVLIDSCVYITLFKQGRDPSMEILASAEIEDIVTCGMVRLEVVRGIATPKARQRTEAFFDVMQNVPTDNKLWEEACELGWQVTRRGYNLPAQDIIIAACAIRADAAVLTYDKHFDAIPGVRVVRSLDELR